MLCPPLLEFSAHPAEIDEGDPTTLSWSCQRCRALTIDHVSRHPGSGSETVRPAFTFVFEARAWGVGTSSNTQVDKSARVVVIPPVPTYLGCDGNHYETLAEAQAVVCYADCAGRRIHSSRAAAEAVECFEDCARGIHLSQADAAAVPCPYTDCGGTGHGTLAEAQAVVCYADCAGRRIHTSQAAAQAVDCYADCAGRRIHLSSAEAATFHCDCDGNPHSSRQAAEAVECPTHRACDGTLHESAALAAAISCDGNPNDCEQAELDDGWGGAWPLGMEPPHCKAADSWETYMEEVEEIVRDEFGQIVYDGFGRPLTQTVLEERRRKLACKNWLAPAAQAFERACSPCSTAAAPGSVPGTSDYSAARTWNRSGIRGRTSVHRAGAGFSLRTSEQDLAELYCEMERMYRNNLGSVETEIGKAVQGRMDFAGGIDTRLLSQRAIAPETVEDAQRLRARRAASIRNLGRASARLKTGLEDGSGGVDWSQSTAANRAAAQAASQAELGRSAIDGEDRSAARAEGGRYSQSGGGLLSGAELGATLDRREIDSGGRTLSSAAAAQRRSDMAAAAQTGGPAVEGLGTGALTGDLSEMSGQTSGRAHEARSRNIGDRGRWVRSPDGRTVRGRIRDHQENMELPDPELFLELWNRGAEGRHGPASQTAVEESGEPGP